MPDTFVLTVPSELPGLVVKKLETPFGTSDEPLAFFKGTLIGAIHSPIQPGRLDISLLPRLDSRRIYPWPTEQEFRSALHSLLETSLDLTLRCEADTDQGIVQEVRDTSSLLTKVGEVLAYSAGSICCCPSFSYRPIAAVRCG